MTCAPSEDSDQPGHPSCLISRCCAPYGWLRIRQTEKAGQMSRLVWVFKRHTSFRWWTMSWENLFMPYANNKDANQPAHPCSLIRAFVVCFLDSIIPLASISEISRLHLASVAAQASLCLTWSQTRRQIFLWRGSNLQLNWYLMRTNIDKVQLPFKYTVKIILFSNKQESYAFCSI